MPAPLNWRSALVLAFASRRRDLDEVEGCPYPDSRGGFCLNNGFLNGGVRMSHHAAQEPCVVGVECDLAGRTIRKTRPPDKHRSLRRRRAFDNDDVIEGASGDPCDAVEGHCRRSRGLARRGAVSNAFVLVDPTASDHFQGPLAKQEDSVACHHRLPDALADGVEEQSTFLHWHIEPASDPLREFTFIEATHYRNSIEMMRYSCVRKNIFALFSAVPFCYYST